MDKEHKYKSDECRILIFSGTTEGNQIAKALCKLPVKVYVSVATEYGEVCAKGQSEAEVISGRMDCEAMQQFLETYQIDIVIDATHPFAKIVTENIQKVCDVMQKTYIRCVRETESQKFESEDCICVETIDRAVEYLQETTGNVLITTGGKELHKYTAIEEYRDRCYARVLSTEKSMHEAVALGFEGKHLIAMQGPFTKEMNIALLHYTDAAYLVTKESGKSGGFEEKLEAARCTGAKVVIIRRPIENGRSVEQIIEDIERSCF